MTIARFAPSPTGSPRVGNARAAIIIVLSLFLSVPAGAKSICPITLDKSDFERNGGRLVIVRRPLVVHITCSEFSCYGVFEATDIIDTHGRVGDFRVLRNTWRDNPRVAESWMRRRALAWRYAAPMLSSMHVCVRETWKLAYTGREVWKGDE